VNKDRRQLGMAPIKNLSELDEPGLELATASFKRRREAQAAKQAAPTAAGLDTAALDEYAASLGRDPATMTAEEWDRLGQELIDEAERYFGASAERQVQRGITAAEREGATRGRLANQTALPLAADEIRERVVREARNAQRQAKRQGNKARLRATEQRLGREEAARMNQLADLGRQAQERAARLGMPANPEQAITDVVDSLTNVAPSRAALTAETTPRVQAAIDVLKLELQHAPAGALGITPQQITEVRKWLRRTRARMNQTRAVAGRVGTLTRDAILHNYADKRTADSLLSYGLMFHYWPTRTAKTLAVTMANNPALLARYLRYKEALAQVNQGLPKWWRDQIGVTIGDTGYFANLEQTLNPVYNMIGNDFQDVDKEGTPFGRTVEAIGNAGLGSVWTPVVWAHALHLATQGDTAGADAWVGYLSSATRTFKYATALLRDQYPATAAVIPPGGITLEPWLWGRDAQGALTYFQGADKYQRKRIGVATQGLVESGQLTPEQQMDTLYAQAGPGWDMAMQQEARMRGPAALVGFFFGQGFKGRQAWEAEVDRANQEWSDNIAPLKATDMAAYRAASDRFFEQYPFMSAVWMAGRNDERREYSYVRNVLNRIPPGKAGDAITEAAQLDGDLLRRFYDTQGFEGWSKQDHDRFMASILDIGATLKIPDTPTRTEWQAARNERRAVYEARDRQWPNYEQDNAEYWRLRETDQAAATEYARTHGLFDAWDFARAQIVENPQLFAYYGDAGDLQKYAEDRMYAERDRQWPQFQEVNARYMSFPKGSQERKAILADNPWLKQAWDWMDQQKAALAANPPTTPPGGAVAPVGAEVRQDVVIDVLPPTVAAIEQWRAPIEQTAQAAGIDPRVIATIVYLESTGDPNRIGRDQDTGLMQVVARESGYAWAADRPTQQELLDPAFNLQTGTAIFKGALDANGGDVRKALAQYNTGQPDTTTEAAQRYLAMYDAAWGKLWGAGEQSPGSLAVGGVTASPAVAAAATGQLPTAPAATTTATAGNYAPLTKFTPLRGQVARRAYYGGGGGGGGGGYSSAVLKRMTPALLAQLWQYFLNGAPLESGALNELATLGITDYDKLRPAFASGIPVTQRSSRSSNQYWRSW